jgi:peptidoglycan-N-acetylglucosamine deacetylase
VIRLASLVLATLLVLGSAIETTGSDATVRLIYRGAHDEPVVALTFDDGYSPANCAKIVDILERRHVTATFFPYAWAVGAAPAFWRRVADDGFPIANHTTSHPDMTRLTLAEATSEISRARLRIEKITGHEMIRVFRPPYGAWNATVIEAARDAGFPTVLLWDVDTHDWAASATPSGVLRAALRGGKGSVVVMHCGPSVTPDILDQVITGYQKRGFGFVTVPQLLSGNVPATAFPPPAPEPVTVPPVATPAPPVTLVMTFMSLAWMHRTVDWPI